jgi:capsular exopolysaccharide synthesis family protein
MNPLDLEPARPGRAVSPTEGLAFLWRGRFTIALLTLLGAGGGVFYAQHRGTIYRARSVLYVERDSPMMPGSSVSLWLQSRNYANTQAALLRSTPILEKSLANPSLVTSRLFGDSTNRLAWLARHLSVAVGIEDDLITVGLDSVQIEDACTVVNSVVDAYLSFHARNRRETAGEVLVGLQQQLSRHESELAAIQKEQAEFLAKHPTLMPSGESGKIATERLRELNTAMTRAEIDTSEAEAAWQAAKTIAESGDALRRLPLLNGDPVLAQEAIGDVKRVDELKQRRLALQQEVTADHPDLVRLDVAIATLEKENAVHAQQLAQAAINALEARYRGAKQRFDSLAERIAAEEQHLHNVDPAEAEYRGIEMRYDRARKIADSLYERIRSIDINEKVDTSDKPQLSTLVYEYASPDSAPVASSKTAIAAIATFVGFVLGIALAWFRALTDQRLRSPDDVVAQLALLGTLPRVAIDPRGVLHGWKRSPEYVAAMRSLRTVLQFNVRSARHRVLQVTSVRNGDGKSTVVAGLGIAMAMAGERTLIVDADVGRASQARLFGVDGEVGLAQALAGRSPAAEVIFGTGIENLHLLPAGAAGAGDLLEAGRLRAILQQVAADFDRVLIDSPPLLERVDARIIAAASDETVIVLRAGRTTRAMVESCLAIVAAVAGRVAGAVLNWSSRGSGLGGGTAHPGYAEPSAEAGRRAAPDLPHAAGPRGHA